MLINSDKQPVGMKLTSMSGVQTFNEVIITDPTREKRAYIALKLSQFYHGYKQTD